MSEETIKAVKQFLNDKFINANDIDTFISIQMRRGIHPKRTIDANRTNQNYYKLNDIQTELLNHYEHVDWYERNYEYDLDPYIEKM